jgi:hypothetical protein
VLPCNRRMCTSQTDEVQQLSPSRNILVVATREPDNSACQTAFRPASDPSEERGENLSSGGKAAKCAWQHWKSDTVPLLYDWLIHRKR